MAASKKARSSRHRRKPDPHAREVGEGIRRLRREQDFKFDAFVEETGLGRGYVSELERGLVVPSIHVLAKVAAALELTIADLVLGDSMRERLFELTQELSERDLRRLVRDVEKLVAKD